MARKIWNDYYDYVGQLGPVADTLWNLNNKKNTNAEMPKMVLGSFGGSVAIALFVQQRVLIIILFNLHVLIQSSLENEFE